MQVDNFDTAEEACRYMTTDMFKKNPLGADFDPEELVKRLERGENEEEIKKAVTWDRGISELVGSLENGA